MEQPLIPLAEAAARLAVSVKTIRRWQKAGRLKAGDCTLVGARWKMRPAAVEKIARGAYPGLTTAR
jgi:excisionase family DNA binding protein